MLQQRIQNHKNLSKYNQLFFTAVSEREPLQDVNTITLKGEYAKKIEMLAVENLITRGKRLTQKSVAQEMLKLFNDKTVFVQEAVYCNKNGISVVVNAECIDDLAVKRVFELVQSALEQLEGGYGIVKFGQPVSFTLSEIPWLHHH
jgi:ribosomal protein L17